MMSLQYVTIVLVCVLVGVASGCSPSVHERELRELQQKVLLMQSQLSLVKSQLEMLSNDIVVLQNKRMNAQGRLSTELAEQSHFSREVPDRLQVVKLVPQTQVAGKKSQVSAAKSPQVALRAVDVDRDGLSASREESSYEDPAASQLFREGLAAYQEGKHDDAILFFREFVGAYQGNANYDDALYWLAQSHFDKKKYGDSVAGFKKYLSACANGDKRADSLLKLGLSYERLHAFNEARVVFEKLVARFPKSALADLAKAHLRDGVEGTP